MKDLLYCVTLAILWTCIFLNWWSNWRLTRSRKDTEKVRLKLESGIAEVEALREKWVERLKMLEVIPDDEDYGGGN